MNKAVDITKLATLTNIPVTDEEVTKFSSQFDKTLQTVATLEELDTKNVEATPQVTNLQNVFREDVVDTDRMFTQEEALRNARVTYNGYFVVPVVLNET
jgi:aspartyl-tRNA(Asn)/glutamyl-tRNA(Gln) amidotransferase subunit C